MLVNQSLLFLTTGTLSVIHSEFLHKFHYNQLGLKQSKKVKVAHTRLPSVARVPGLIPVLGSQPAGDVSHKPGGRLPLLSARPADTLATVKRAATNCAAR